MPLIQSKTKKALKKNIETEIEAHPSAGKRKQDIAIAYSIQNKNKKKMALGGSVEGASHSKPTYSRNPGTPEKKPDDRRLDPKDYMSDQWAGGPDPKTKPDNNRPPMDEYMANHFAEGGTVEDLKAQGIHVSFPEAEQDSNPNVATHEGRDDEKAPSEDEFMASKFSQGGEVDEPDSTDQPEPEEEEEKHASITAAIMAKKRKNMADGGMVDLEANSEESPNMEDQYSFDAIKKEQYDDSQLSKQPKDSNESGDDREDSEENDHDKGITSAIRKRMKSKRM